jgi:cell division transport system permease protein
MKNMDHISMQNTLNNMKPLKTTFKYMRRSPYQSLAAVLTMFLTLLLTGVFSITSVASIVMLQFFESKPQLTVFFTDKGGKKEADELTQQLIATGKVSATKFVSKDDALVLYKEQNKNDPLLLEMVTADILPASLEITTTKPEYLADIEPMVRKFEIVDEVVYQKDVVESLLKWTRGARLVMGALVIVLSLTAVLVITTVTTMKIAMRREEIEILQLVGASGWYIRYPFLFEGGLYGAVGGFFAWVTITGVVLAERTMLLSFLGSIPVIQTLLSNPVGTIFLLSAGIFGLALSATGFCIGVFGSFLAVNRFLKH